MTKRCLAALLWVVAGCSSAPPIEPVLQSPPATPEEEFERIVRELRSRHEKYPPIVPPSSFYFRPVDKENLLTALACTSPRLYDRLIDLSSSEGGLSGSLRFDHDSPCALGEEYSVGLVSRLMGEKGAHRRQVLLFALRHHARHPHAREAHSQLFASSVPGRLSQAYKTFPENEHWIVAHVLASYSPFVREAFEACFARAADEGEQNLIRAHLFSALFQEAFPKATPEVRYEMLQRFCDLIRARSRAATAGFMEYGMNYLPPGRLLSPDESALCESTLEEVARTSPRGEPRFRALRVLASLGSGHALPLAESLLGDDPSEELVGRAYGALAGIPSTFDPLYSKTKHTIFRAFTDSRRVRSMTGELRDQMTRRLMGWLRDHSDQRVRRVALYGLVVELEDAFRNRRGDPGATLERANEVLDLVLRDPAGGVRELAANYLSSYSSHLGFLDSDTREKIDRLFESVRR